MSSTIRLYFGIMVNYWCCISLFIILYCDKASANHIRFGYQLKGHTFNQILRSSLKQCHIECSSRKVCKSYNYFRAFKLCELNNADKTDAPDDSIKDPSAVYAQKVDWDFTLQVQPECEICDTNEVCESSDMGTAICSVEECQTPPPVFDGAITLGNMRNVDANVKYVCDIDRVTLGQPAAQCNNSGNWSVSDFICVPPTCWTPNTDPKYTYLEITNDTSSVNMHFKCLGNFTTRGSPLQCGVNGRYNYRYACCDSLDDGQWVKIFRVNSGGQSAIIALWQVEDYINYGDGFTEKDCQFRRFDIINSWSMLNIAMVKVQVIVNGTVQAWIIFDGHNSSRDSWFSTERIINSSWIDLGPDSQVPYFSTSGFRRLLTDVLYRFTIIESHDPVNCSLVSGWLALPVQYPCLVSSGYPYILYSPGTTKATTITDFQLADSMEILVKFAN